jgi:hypothetical protein
MFFALAASSHQFNDGMKMPYTSRQTSENCWHESDNQAGMNQTTKMRRLCAFSAMWVEMAGKRQRQLLIIS